MYKKILLCPIFFCLFSLALLSHAGTHTDAGKTAVSWSKIGVGARPSGMGETYTAVGDDAFAIFWNPACLVKVAKQSIAAQLSEWRFIGIKYNAYGIAIPLKDEWGETARTIGIGMTIIDMGEIPETITFEDAQNPSKSFRPTGETAVLCYTQRANPTVSMGVSAKIIRETLYDTTDTIYAGDLGFLIRAGEGESEFDVGIVIQNLLGQSIYGGYNLPRTIKAGVGVTAGTITLGADISMPDDHGMKASVGAEFLLGNAFAFRAGYRYGIEEDKLGTSATSGLPCEISFGLGLNTGVIGFDYSAVPFGSLGDSHRVSVLLEF